MLKKCLVFIIMVAVLNACGLKGPLYVPKNQLVHELVLI